MGIKGLWKEVQPICRPAHISQFRGQRVGVDAYCWLHRAVLASTMPLATGKADDKFIALFISRVELLQRYGVTPVIIFDGASMPMKAGTDEHRHQNREAAKAEGLRLLQAGHAEDAMKQLGKSIDVSTEIAFAVISALRERDVECIVAPYEADAQLAHLCREGYIQAVISEDSDLMVYKCNILLAKMDGGGNCDAVHIRDIPKCTGFTSQQSHEAFVTMCILSGCDYVPSLPSIGIKTAQKLVANCRSIPDLINTLQTQHGFSQRELGPYEEAFHKALYCFTHHLVYDPQLQKIIPFTPFPQQMVPHHELIGDVWDQELAKAVCEEHSHDPCTLLPYVGKHKDSLAIYMKISKKGQRSLTEFTAFERYKANRIVLRQAPEGSWAAGGGPSAAAVPSTVTGFAGFDNGAPPTIVYTKSKYFGAGSKSQSQQANANGLQLSHLVSDMNTVNDPMTGARAFFEEMEDGLPANSPLGADEDDVDEEAKRGLVPEIAEGELLACPSSSSCLDEGSTTNSPVGTQQTVVYCQAAKAATAVSPMSVSPAYLTPPPLPASQPSFSQLLANAQPVRVGLQNARQVSTIMQSQKIIAESASPSPAAAPTSSQPTGTLSPILRILSPATADAASSSTPPEAGPSACPHNNPMCVMAHSSFYKCYAVGAASDSRASVNSKAILSAAPGLGAMLAVVADEPTPIRGLGKRQRSIDQDEPHTSAEVAPRRTEPHILMPSTSHLGTTSPLMGLYSSLDTSPPTKTTRVEPAPHPTSAIDDLSVEMIHTKTSSIHSLANQWRSQQPHRPYLPSQPAAPTQQAPSATSRTVTVLPSDSSDDNSNSVSAIRSSAVALKPTSVSNVTASTRKALELMSQLRGGTASNVAAAQASSPVANSAQVQVRTTAEAVEAISKLAASRPKSAAPSAFASDRATFNRSSSKPSSVPATPSSAAPTKSVDQILSLLAFKRK